MSQSHTRPLLPTAGEIAALPEDGGPNWNRLVFTRSPYLLQHAANPVDWWPWCPEAFERARAEDKPIFLSIGYSTCHWCHVMEHESFEDPRVAALLNEHMIAIKVDREERPDIDQVYMTVTQALTGQGGWPMTVIMTPDKKPFFAGTYYPKHGNQFRPGMMELVPALANAWKTQREKVLDSAEQVTNSIAGLAKGTPGNLPGVEALEDALEILGDQYDSQHAGFGRGRNKFPIPHNLSLLLRLHARTGRDDARDMATETLRAMRRGGIFDQVGFGFHRYSTDREWLLPHFEKMLYDQAMLLIAYAEAHAATGEATFADTAREIIAYVTRDMTSPGGGFFSAEDADSEGVEGKFYVWTPEEVREVLAPEDSDVWCRVFQIREGGNFHDEATGEKPGESIPHLRGPIPPDEAERMEACRTALFAHREARVHPFKDDKVLADWNGLMIAGLAVAGRLLPDPTATGAALRAAEFVLGHLRDDRGRLIKCYRDGSAAGDGQLEDYAFMAWGLLELYETTLDTRWLRECLALVEVLRRHFADPAGGGFFQVADDAEQLLVRAKDAYDGAIPSGNGAAAWVLARLARMTGNADLEHDARRTMEAFGETLAKAPTAHAQMLIALDLLLGPSREVVLVGTPGEEAFEALRREATRRFHPRTVVLHRPPGEPGEIAGWAPFVAGMQADRAAAFVCENFACRQPVHTTGELATLLGG